MRPNKNWRVLAGITSAIMFAAIFAVSAAFAQQGQFLPPPPPPSANLHGQQGGSVLEVPTMPGRQSGGSATLPRIVPGPQTGELTVPSHQLSRQAGYEQVTVTVTDQQGHYVTGLQKSDFRLYIDGQQRPIDFFRQDFNTPVSIGILVDTSGSMEPKIPQARAAISEFLHDLNAQDDVFLFAFSSKPFLLQPFTTNHYLVMSRLSLLHAYGQTSLFDTIEDGLLMVRHGRYDKKALLVVTDGMDNTSQSTLQQVVGLARRQGVLIYSIGIGEPNSSAPPVAFNFGPFAVFSGSEDEVDTRTLQLLSTETGAKTFLVREAGDGELLRSYCAQISRELRQQYTVGFVAPDPSRGGYRDLRVEAPGRPGDHVRARKGVTVGATESASADGGYGGP